MRFEFATATRILFGPGTLKEVGAVSKGFGSRALVVTGRTVARAESLRTLLGASGVESVPFPVGGEPTLEWVEAGVALAKAERCDWVAGFGGGSALDGAKAIAALLTNPGRLLDYLEVIGQARPLCQCPAPWLAVPTTAGTGAEVTRNAVLTSPLHHLKASLRSPLLLPRVALVDPELTRSLPPPLTASTGLDALTQLIEPYVSSRANALTDGLCVEGLRRSARSLRRACEQGDDLAAREDLALASLLSGLALANAGLGAVHGFAAPLGGRFAAPHGAVCAALLPAVMVLTVRALRQRAPNHPAGPRYEAVARLLTGKASASIEDGVAWVRDLNWSLKIPPLRAYGVSRHDFPALAAQAAQSSSMKGNPIELTAAEMEEILELAWD